MAQSLFTSLKVILKVKEKDMHDALFVRRQSNREACRLLPTATSLLSFIVQVSTMCAPRVMGKNNVIA